MKKELLLAAWAIAAGQWRRYQQWRLRRAVERAGRALQELALTTDQAAARMRTFVEAMRK
jgi:hypothetical protein